MDLSLLDQRGALGDALPTLRADIRLLTCMEKLATGWEIVPTLRTGKLGSHCRFWFIMEGELGVRTLQESLRQRKSWGRGEWRRKEGGLINTGERKWRHQGG